MRSIVILLGLLLPIACAGVQTPSRYEECHFTELSAPQRVFYSRRAAALAQSNAAYVRACWRGQEFACIELLLNEASLPGDEAFAPEDSVEEGRPFALVEISAQGPRAPDAMRGHAGLAWAQWREIAIKGAGLAGATPKDPELARLLDEMAKQMAPLLAGESRTGP